MAGMTTTGLPKFSDYSVRNVVIEVTGLCRQDVMKTSNYEMKVPFNRYVSSNADHSPYGWKSCQH